MKPNCLRACLCYRRWRYHLGCLASSGAKLGTLKIPFLYGGLQQDTEWGQAADLRIAGMLMREQSMPLLDCLRWLYYIHLGGSCCYLVTTGHRGSGTANLFGRLARHGHRQLNRLSHYCWPNLFYVISLRLITLWLLHRTFDYDCESI